MRVRPRFRVIHEATGENWKVQVNFEAAAGVADNVWQIPADAKLGNYRVVVDFEGANGQGLAEQSGRRIPG